MCHVERGNLVAVKLCVALGADVNFPDPSRQVVTVPIMLMM
jgi:hypothetical protein